MPNEIATHGGPPHRASDRSASARRGGSSGRGTGDAMDMGMAQARSLAMRISLRCARPPRPGRVHRNVRTSFMCKNRLPMYFAHELARCTMTITAYCESFLLQLL